MNTSSPAPLDNALNRVESAVSSVTGWLHRAGHDCDAAVRDHPREAMLLSFAAGAIATRHPLKMMLASGCKIAWTFAPTALALFGAFKLARHLAHLDETRARFVPVDNIDPLPSPEPLPPSLVLG